MNTKKVGVCLWMGLLAWAPHLAWTAGADARLADAVMRSERETVRSLLQQKNDVNATQTEGMTALHWAVRGDRADTAQFLVRSGPKVNAAARNGGTPLYLA